MSASEPALDAAFVEPEIDLTELDKIILEDYGRNRENLIMMMQAIQRKYRYLPEVALRYLGQVMNVPYTKLFEVGTFYASFSLVPKGKHIVHICTGTACHLKGSRRLVDHICGATSLEPGGTTPDLKLTVETVNCLGACAVAPVAVIDEEYHPKADLKLLNEFLDQLNQE
jgi:NADH-quinone oxidoreductase subunit E